MNNKWLIAAVIIVVLGGIWYFAARPKVASGEPIKIGADFSLSSFGAGWGENDRDAAMLAVKEINAKGGVLGRPLQLNIQDNQSTAKDAVSAAQNLIAGGAKFLLTGWTDQTLAVAPLLVPNNVLGITISAGSNNVTDGSPNLFRVWPADAGQATAIAEYIHDKGYKRVAIFHNPGFYEDDLYARFKQDAARLGLTLVADQAIPDAQTSDVRTPMAKIKEANPDVIYFNTITGLGIREARRIGLNVAMAWFNDATDETFTNKAGGVAALEGLVYPVHGPSTPGFVDAFKKEYNREPGTSANTTYDGVMLLAQAIERAGSTDITKVSAELLKVKDYQGASGTITINDKRDRAMGEVIIMQVKNGQYVKAE